MPKCAGVVARSGVVEANVRKPNRYVVAFLGLGACLGGATLYAMGGTCSATTAAFDDSPQPVLHTLLDAVPSDAQIVWALDVGSIRRSPYAVWLSRETGLGFGIDCRRVVEDHVEALVAWEPSEQEAGLALAAWVDASESALLECTEHYVVERGAVPIITQRDGFKVITDDGLGPNAARLAVRDPGLVLLGPPNSHSRMIEAVERRISSVRRGGKHARMRDEIGAGDLTLSIVVDARLRSRIRDWVGEPTLVELLEGCAVAVDFQETTVLRSVFWCETEKGCADVVNQLGTLRERLVDSLPIPSAFLASWFESMQVQHDGMKVSVRVAVSASQVLGMVEYLKQELW